MPIEMTTVALRLGISRCLLGEEVRYDGRHNLDNFLTKVLGRYVEWIPVCPEVEAGLGTPREAMRLVGNPQNPRLITIDSKIDHTRALETMATTRAASSERSATPRAAEGTGRAIEPAIASRSSA